MTVNGNNVIAADNEATNGVIHVIDSVLLPLQVSETGLVPTCYLDGPGTTVVPCSPSTSTTTTTESSTTLGSETESGSEEEEVSLPSLQPSPSPMVAANCEDDPGQACLAISTDGYLNGNGNANGHLNPLLYHYPLYNSVEGVPKGCKSSGLTACGKRLDGKTNRCYAEITAGSCGILLHNSGGFSVEEEGDYARKWTNLVGPPANLAAQRQKAEARAAKESKQKYEASKESNAKVMQAWAATHG